MKKPQPNRRAKKKKNPNAKLVDCLEQLPKEINAEPGKAVKFFLGFLLVREKWHTLGLVTQTLFKVQIEKNSYFSLGVLDGLQMCNRV